MCFEILGFDIMILDDHTPILIEVNHSPSFCTESPLDLAIKKCLILDTFNLLQFKHEDKVNYLKLKVNYEIAIHPAFNGSRGLRGNDKSKINPA